MKKKFLVLTYLIFLQINAQGIQEFQTPDYAPKTPEAAAFLKYGEYPVNLSTGVTDITIPIYTIALKGYSLPISLNYHPSGIKVVQEASWVGLGWNLNAGAQIILSVRDDVDENNSQINNIPSDASLDYYNTNPYAFTSGPILSEELDKSRVRDVYYLSSPTANGQFYIKNSSGLVSEIVVFPPDAFKVETINGINDMPSGGRSKFRVTDKMGNVYIFRTSEVSVRQNTQQNNYFSAWYVDEIKTSNNEVINFEYEPDGELVENSKM